MILITGAHKAFALYKAIEEGVNHMWTVSAFQQHAKTLMLCDEDATLELRVKTVKYFKVRPIVQNILFTSIDLITTFLFAENRYFLQVWKYIGPSLGMHAFNLWINFSHKNIAVNQAINNRIKFGRFFFLVLWCHIEIYGMRFSVIFIFALLSLSPQNNSFANKYNFFKLTLSFMTITKKKKWWWTITDGFNDYFIQ